jgi:CBS domain containing-hemolysin-like protein
MSHSTLSSVVAIVVLVFLSGFFSATETAFSALNRTRIKTLADQGDRRAALVLQLSDQYDKLLSTILVGNNIVNISMASIATILFVRLLGAGGATVSTIVITVAVLIFGEVSPKSLAKEQPEKFAMVVAPIIRALMVLMTPVNFLFTCWKSLLSKVFKSDEDRRTSHEELLTMVEEVEQEGGIDELESELLRSAIEFNDLEAADILTPRVDVEGVSLEATREEIADIFAESGYSRLPVYDGTIDRIVGFIHMKDFFEGGHITDKSVTEIMTTPLFVPPSAKVDDLLRMLQRTKSHIAVVTDEYGGTLGIITMEDILEELVGEIYDEHDEVEESFTKLDDHTYKVLASTDLDEFFEFFSLPEDSETDSSSVSGWVMEQMEKVPDEGDSFTFENLSITVTATDFQRVLEIQVVIQDPVEEPEN